MSVENCIFCKMAAGQIPVTKVYEDDVVLAFLDIGPVSDGHTLIVPKQHFERLDDCPAELLAQVASRLGRIARAIYHGMKADGYNLLCNNGQAAGQVVKHLHFHLIPRRAGDHIFTEWPAHKYAAGIAERTADEICKNF